MYRKRTRNRGVHTPTPVRLQAFATARLTPDKRNYEGKIVPGASLGASILTMLGMAWEAQSYETYERFQPVIMGSLR